jgi:flagellar biogenesis protein FliO
MNGGTFDGVRLVLAILGGALLIGTWLWSMRLRTQGPKKSLAGELEVIGRLGIEHRRTLFLVRAGEQRFLVGSSETGLSLLGSVPCAASGGGRNHGDE